MGLGIFVCVEPAAWHASQDLNMDDSGLLIVTSHAGWPHGVLRTFHSRCVRSAVTQAQLSC